MIELCVEASSAPLPLFAHASFAYADKLKKDGDADAALRAARFQFGEPRGNAGQSKDLPDAYVEQLFGDFDSMLSQAQDRFVDTALRLYAPLLLARTTEDGS
jgi:predicted TPR repeat methyltransferase